MAKGKLVLKTDKCKGCELCVAVCPKEILAIDEDALNSKGYHPIAVLNEDACIACGNCGIICPDGVINVYVAEAGGKN